MSVIPTGWAISARKSSLFLNRSMVGVSEMLRALASFHIFPMTPPIPKPRAYVLLLLAVLAGLSFIGSEYQEYLPLQHIPTTIGLFLMIWYMKKYTVSDASF